MWGDTPVDDWNDESQELGIRARLTRHTDAEDTWKCVLTMLAAMAGHARKLHEEGLERCLAEALLHVNDIGQRLEWEEMIPPNDVWKIEELVDKR